MINNFKETTKHTHTHTNIGPIIIESNKKKSTPIYMECESIEFSHILVIKKQTRFSLFHTHIRT